MKRVIGRFQIVFVTVPDVKTARSLAKAMLAARLIACANIIPKVESIYVWKEKVETSSELLMILKTSKARLKALEELILSMHPYDTPEIVALPIESGTEKYVEWMRGATI